LALTAGTRLGPYEIIAALGAGGMGEVYKARDTRLDRIVAIKVLPKRLSEDPEFVKRFYKEGRAAARLNHNNIVQAFDVGEYAGFHYFVMEFVDG
jgi:serine/threonine-protein kinase